MVDGVVHIPLPGKTLAAATADATPRRACPATTPRNAESSDDHHSPTILKLHSPTRHDTGSTHFLAGPENQLVEIAVRAVVDGRPNGYNPLVLYGPSGTGKSHLAHGLAAVWKARPTARRQPPTLRRGSPDPAESPDRPQGRQRVVCTTAVDFARELTDAAETQAVDEFRAKHRDAAMLVVEDLGQLATRRSGKLSAQEELIHTIDALVADGRWVVVTASSPPWEVPGIMPMLQSRLTGGLVVRLSPPGPETRIALLHQLASQRDIELPDPVAQLLAEGLTGTARELAGALLELALGNDPSATRSSDTTDAPPRLLDLAAARQYLAGGHRGRQPTLHEIALATARHFSLRLSDLKSPSRRRALVAARGVAVCLARDVAGQRLEEIGRYFGGRDHTTVLHNYRTTKELIATDPAIRTAVEQLQAALWKT